MPVFKFKGNRKPTVVVDRERLLSMAATIAAGLTRLDQSQRDEVLEQVDLHIAARAVRIAAFIVDHIDGRSKGS